MTAPSMKYNVFMMLTFWRNYHQLFSGLLQLKHPAIIRNANSQKGQCQYFSKSSCELSESDTFTNTSAINQQIIY